MSFALPDRNTFDAYLQWPSEAARVRPGATLEYFIGRRRSTAVGRRFWRFAAQNWAAFDGIERARCVRMFARFRPDWRGSVTCQSGTGPIGCRDVPSAGARDPRVGAGPTRGKVAPSRLGCLERIVLLRGP